MMILDVRDDFVAELRARRLTPATIDAYLDGVDRFDKAHSEIDLRGVGRREIDAYVATLSSSTLKLTTVSILLRGLRRFFEYLVEKQRLLLSPMDHLRQKYVQPLPGRVLDEKDVARFCTAPNTSVPLGIRDRALLELLYATGVRKIELCALEVFDVDLTGGLLRVRQGKGGKERFVPLSNAAQAWLREYLREIRPHFAKKSEDSVRALFLTRTGRRLDGNAVDQVLLKYARKKGMKRVSCHALRRTVATSMLKRGADIRVVAELLGHSQVVTTQRYTRLVIGDVRKEHARTHPRGGGNGDR
jgi:integrase/recombinase XerD